MQYHWCFLILSVLALLVTPKTSFCASPFSDLTQAHWSYPFVKKSVDEGILQGHNGKFDGQGQLDRFQIAVITARLLDKTRPKNYVELQHELRSRDSLLETFEEELEVLEHRVSTLDNEYLEIVRQRDKGVAQRRVDIPISAFASFGLIKTDDQNAGIPHTRFVEADSLFFTIPQVSLGLDKEVAKDTHFHGQFDFGSQINGVQGVTINEAFFTFAELFEDTKARMGYFALPFTTEHIGPFRTAQRTITPSWINTLNEAWRLFGVSAEGHYQERNIAWTFGVGSGTETNTLFDTPTRLALFNDAPGGGANIERDDAFSYFFQIGREVSEKGAFGWKFGYFDNNGRPNQVGTPTSQEISFWQLSFEVPYRDFTIMGHLLDGDWQLIGSPTTDGFKSWNILVNYKICGRDNATIRFDDWEFARGGPGRSGFAITAAYNHQVTENSYLQFEFLTPQEEDDSTNVDADDDLIQLRYKVFF